MPSIRLVYKSVTLWVYLVTNSLDYKQKAESGLKNVYEWLISNKLSLSWDKTNFIIFHPPRKKIEDIQELKVYDFKVKRVSVVVYLGMHIDEHLKWDKHISHICNSLSKNFHMFYTIRNLLTKQLKKQIYYSLVHSRILYGIEVYGACNSTLLKKVQTIQNKLLKVLFNLPFRTDTNKMHAELKLLKVKDIYNVSVLKFTYESVNKCSIIQFQNYFHHHNSLHTHNTRNDNNLYTHRVRTKYGESTLKYTGTQLWNSLARDIQQSKSIFVFKRSLKDKYINSYS